MLCSNIVNNIMLPYLCAGQYTKNISNYTKSCCQKNIEYFFEYIGMISTKHLTVQLFIGTKAIEIIPSNNLGLHFISTTDYKVWFYDLQSLESICLLKMSIFMAPIYCTINGINHIMLFVIDKIKQCISILDVNCNNNYASLYEASMRKTITAFNKKHNMRFKIKKIIYEKQCRLKNINSEFMCTQISIFIAHYIHLTKHDVNTAMKHISYITKKQLINMIKDHSKYFYICTIR